MQPNGKLLQPAPLASLRLLEAARPHLAGFTEAQLVAWARSKGATTGAARVAARALLARFCGRAPPADAPSAALLAQADRELDSALPRAEAVTDPDGTVRFAVHLADGAIVETVAIHQPAADAPDDSGERPAGESFGRARERWTLCVSSQVGCARGCVFCETGRLGLVRNLSAAEIVAQYALAARHLSGARAGASEATQSAGESGAERAGEALRNVVFMGMGEPLDNLGAVLQAVQVLRERAGFAVPERRITVSTVGVPAKMDELAAESRVNLAVSLHALEPEAREALLPIARKVPLAELRAAIARAPRTVLLQWTLIEGVNDSDDDVERLASFCAGLDVRVNLIPLNPGPSPAQRAPPLAACRRFQKLLLDRGVRTMLRLPHGQSVGGACGQLAGAARTANSTSGGP